MSSEKAEQLNATLKGLVTEALEPYSEEILETWEETKDKYVDEIMPVYERASGLRSEVVRWYGSGMGERDPVGRISELMHVVSTLMVPVYARSDWSKEMVAETEAKDQFCNLQLRNTISQSIDVPFPVLAPTMIDDESGEVGDVFDLVIEAGDEPRLNSFGRAALLGLIEMGKEVPEEFNGLLNPVTGME